MSSLNLPTYFDHHQIRFVQRIFTKFHRFLYDYGIDPDLAIDSSLSFDIIFIFDKKFDANDPNQYEFDILQRVSPKKNRALFFDGLYYHAGSYPIQHQHRIMLNCNLITE